MIFKRFSIVEILYDFFQLPRYSYSLAIQCFFYNLISWRESLVINSTLIFIGFRLNARSWSANRIFFCFLSTFFSGDFVIHCCWSMEVVGNFKSLSVYPIFEFRIIKNLYRKTIIISINLANSTSRYLCSRIFRFFFKFRFLLLCSHRYFVDSNSIFLLFFIFLYFHSWAMLTRRR